LTYRHLALFPLVLAALGATALVLAPASARDTVVQVEVDIAKALALVGLALAARAFDRGDYLRRGWGLWAVGYGCFLARDAALLLSPVLPEVTVHATRGVLVGVGNTCVAISAWTLARAWSVAGLEHPGSRGTRVLVAALAVLATAALVGPQLVLDLRPLLDGKLSTLDGIASDLGDMISLPIVAPVALTAVAVRAGTLRWTWGLLTGSLVVWVVYDAIYALPSYFGAVPGSAILVSEQFHVLAALLACAAGLAQRKAVTDEDEA